MRRRWTRPVASSMALLLLGGVAAAGGAPAGVAATGVERVAPAASDFHRALRFADASIIIEKNATDGDAGLQFFLDARGWRRVAVTAPDGRRMMVVRNRGSLRTWGLTELFSESSEPSFDEAPFWKFKKRFPEGTYRFEGTTVGGRRLVGRARLTHDIPKGPVITSPGDGASVPLGDVLASWNPVTKPPGIRIVGYRAIVSDETSPRGFGLELELRRSQTSFTIPALFLRAGNDYKLEVQAIERSGNQTASEIEFSVA